MWYLCCRSSVQPQRMPGASTKLGGAAAALRLTATLPHGTSSLVVVSTSAFDNPMRNVAQRLIPAASVSSSAAGALTKPHQVKAGRTSKAQGSGAPGEPGPQLHSSANDCHDGSLFGNDNPAGRNKASFLPVYTTKEEDGTAGTAAQPPPQGAISSATASSPMHGHPSTPSTPPFSFTAGVVTVGEDLDLDAGFPSLSAAGPTAAPGGTTFAADPAHFAVGTSVLPLRTEQGDSDELDV